MVQANAFPWNADQKNQFSSVFSKGANSSKILQASVDLVIYQEKLKLTSYGSGTIVLYNDRLYVVTNQHNFFDKEAKYHVVIPGLGVRYFKNIVSDLPNVDLIALTLFLSSQDEQYLKKYASIELPGRTADPYSLFYGSKVLIHVPSELNQPKYVSPLTRKGNVVRMNLGTHPGLDVAVNMQTFPGDSGSPVVDQNGKLMAIEAMGISIRDYSESILIQVNEVYHLLEDECPINIPFDVSKWESMRSKNWFLYYRKLRDFWLENSAKKEMQPLIYSQIVSLDKMSPDTLAILDFKAYIEESGMNNIENSNQTRKVLCGEVYSQNETNIGFEYDLESQFNLANTFYLLYNAEQCLIITRQLIEDHAYFKPAHWLHKLCDDRSFWNAVLPWR